MNVSGSIALQMLGKGFWNTITERPLSVSFEVTHSCTANCWHCNWGGPIKETRLPPNRYGEICRRLDPVVCNVSGGEPLARGDITEIVRAIARPGRLPWMVLVTNASQLTPEKFLELKRAGIHQLSVSIDFPDDRHSEFRRIPGLFERMAHVLPECARLGDEGDVSLNCCITAWNYRALPDIVHLARRWGVGLNFSAYTPLRMDEPRGLVAHNGSAAELKKVLHDVIALKRAGLPVYTSERVLWRYYTFLTGGRIAGCKAGIRFLVINPDGRFTPCAMVMAYFYDQATMRREFSRCNSCTACYISTRANSEKTAGEFILDNLAILERLLPWRWPVFARGTPRPAGETPP